MIRDERNYIDFAARADSSCNPRESKTVVVGCITIAVPKNISRGEESIKVKDSEKMKLKKVD